MIQGGDPTGTGRGGESIYGGKFEDEFDAGLVHDRKGVVSMVRFACTILHLVCFAHGKNLYCPAFFLMGEADFVLLFVG